jgi:hypothetical protein
MLPAHPAFSKQKQAQKRGTAIPEDRRSREMLVLAFRLAYRTPATQGIAMTQITRLAGGSVKFPLPVSEGPSATRAA